MRPFLQRLSPLGQLLAFLLFSFLSLALFQFLGVILAKTFFGISAEALSTQLNFDNPDYLNITLLFSVLNALGMFLLPALTFASLISDDAYTYLRMNKQLKTLIFGLSLLLVLLSLPVINFTSAVNLMVELPEWMQQEEGKREQLIMAFLEQKSIWLNLLVLAVVPAFAEEIFFRGVFQNLLLRLVKGRVHLAVILVALFFSALHIQFAGFLPRFFMGLLLGYLYVYSKSLWPCIVVHFLNNGFSVVLGALVVGNTSLEELEHLGEAVTLSTFIVFVISLALMVLVMREIKRLAL